MKGEGREGLARQALVAFVDWNWCSETIEKERGMCLCAFALGTGGGPLFRNYSIDSTHRPCTCETWPNGSSGPFLNSFSSGWPAKYVPSPDQSVLHYLKMQCVLTGSGMALIRAL